MMNNLTKEEIARHNAVLGQLFLRLMFPLWVLGYGLILALTWWPAPFWLIDGLAWLQTHIPSLRMAARVGDKYGETAIPNQVMVLYGMLMHFGFTGYFLVVGLREMDKEYSQWPMFKNIRLEAYNRPWWSIRLALAFIAGLLFWYLLYAIEPKEISRRSVGLWDSNFVSYVLFHCVGVVCLSAFPVFAITLMRYSFQKILGRS
jgi:hypothetical protein